MTDRADSLIASVTFRVSDEELLAPIDVEWAAPAESGSPAADD